MVPHGETGAYLTKKIHRQMQPAVQHPRRRVRAPQAVKSKDAALPGKMSARKARQPAQYEKGGFCSLAEG